MTLPLPSFRSSLAAVICAAAGAAAFPAARGQTPEAADEALQLLFQLGLPDTRGAKWVAASGELIRPEPAIPGLPNRSRQMNNLMTGNAWLVREERDGTVELIVAQSRRIRMQQVAREGDVARGPRFLPSVQIAPADLEEDTKEFAAALTAEKPATPVDPDIDSDNAPEAGTDVGEWLLFLAHLHRQGRTAFVRKLLPNLLARAVTPEAALDGAISLLADSRLAQATADWSERGDATGYAKTIDELCHEFSRGWTNREAARRLAQRVRRPEIPASAHDPAAKKAAAFLLALKPQEISELPLGHNWLLPGARTRQSYRGSRVMIPVEEDVAELESPDEEKSAPRSVRSSAVATFFAGRRDVLAPIARLLGDQRMLRVLPSSDGIRGRSRNYDVGKRSPEEELKEAYDHLPRPYELGEIASMLLAPLLPEEMRYSGMAPQTATVLPWIAQIAKLSDEELAWDYLRRARNTYGDAFQSALPWLVQHGSIASLAKLEAVFTDSAVWSGGTEYHVLPVLAMYLKRFSGDPAVFSDKVRAAFKTAIDEQQLQEMTNAGADLSEQRKQQFARETAAKFKQLDQIFKPRTFGELLQEAAAAKDDEVTTLVETISAALAQTTWAEAEPQLFAAAAGAKSVEMKQGLLQLIMAQSRAAIRAKKSASPSAYSPATRAAIETLLADETATEGWMGMEGQPIAQITAGALVWPRLTTAEQSATMVLLQSDPEVGSIWIKARARAVTRGETSPPFPNARNVPPARVEALLGALASLSPEPLLATFRLRSMDEQLAVIEHLGKLERWPEALVAADLTIKKVGGPAAERSAVDSLKDRRFDDAIRRQLDVAAENAAAEGRRISFVLQRVGTLAGLTLSCVATDESTPAEDLSDLEIPGLDGKPTPIAVLGYSLRIGMPPDGGMYGYLVPLWKEAPHNEAWRAEAAKLANADPSPDSTPDQETDDESAEPNNRAAFEKQLKSLLALEAKARRPFVLTWSVMIVPSEAEADP